MARFYGKVGYGETTETVPGVYVDEIVERVYYGDVIRNSRRLDETSDKLNYDLSVGNSISVVADAYAYEHFFNIRYVEWLGALWTVSNVEVQRPRLILQLGKVYNGETPGTADHP